MEQELTGADRVLIEIAELTAVVVAERDDGDKPTLRSAAAMANVDFARAQWLIEARERPAVPPALPFKTDSDGFSKDDKAEQ